MSRLLRHLPWASANRFRVISGPRGKNDIEIENGFGRYMELADSSCTVPVLAQGHWQADDIVKAFIVVKGVLKAILPISMIV